MQSNIWWKLKTQKDLREFWRYLVHGREIIFNSKLVATEKMQLIALVSFSKDFLDVLVAVFLQAEQRKLKMLKSSCSGLCVKR